MTGAEIVKLCDGIADAMLTHLEAGAGADTMMLTHAVRDLAFACAEQQRQISRLVEVHGT